MLEMEVGEFVSVLVVSFAIIHTIITHKIFGREHLEILQFWLCKARSQATLYK